MHLKCRCDPCKKDPTGAGMSCRACQSRSPTAARLPAIPCPCEVDARWTFRSRIATAETRARGKTKRAVSCCQCNSAGNVSEPWSVALARNIDKKVRSATTARLACETSGREILKS